MHEFGLRVVGRFLCRVSGSVLLSHGGRWLRDNTGPGERRVGESASGDRITTPLGELTNWRLDGWLLPSVAMWLGHSQCWMHTVLAVLAVPASAALACGPGGAVG